MDAILGLFISSLEWIISFLRLFLGGQTTTTPTLQNNWLDIFAGLQNTLIDAFSGLSGDWVNTLGGGLGEIFLDTVDLQNLWGLLGGLLG